MMYKFTTPLEKARTIEFTTPVLMAGTFFCTFWWELARWMDSSMLNALYGDVGIGYKFALSLPTAFGNDASVTDMVMKFVIGALFLLLPMIFFAVMGWAGVQVGSSIGQMMTNSTKSSADAGGSAAGKAVDAGQNKLISMAGRR
ncbi:MAG: conjugal transfer protein TraG N-terminal domain-containing protein [Burkholderiales bacterium]|jgi:hypothetical protein|nr:conjugal transfer protein TraG N-terminal domain-containing protein [Burkholderiales bacterium]